MPGYACARFGGEGACPEDTHAPQSIEGRALVAAGREMFHQRRIGGAGYAGLDMPACLELLKAQGVNTHIAALLLPFWESGLLEAAAKLREQDKSK
ncbi:hypothetical protein AL035_17760 [Salipiger aestuarii]|uniref:Uncharacterized protein n=1 Tax=Salipiger aestuarii TaxID=568098 RepID=A0A327YT19_9RHOB|nr:hypothetical protein [Salipiger aestuarii]KAB2539656.1 hypothetical protein AL035_17760 [Salipiger aestuarii]RAK24110.1 hypothetical protein ATI53_1001217 [Salipiger aestuarii]